MAHKGTPFDVRSDDLATASLPGAMAAADFSKLDTVPAGVTLLAAGKTATIDMLVTGDYLINLPLMSGKRAIVLGGRWVVTTRTGTPTGNVTYNVGNNASNYDNILNGGSLTGVAIAAFATIPFANNSFSGGGAPDMTTDQLRVKITGNPTVITVLQGYLLLSVWYV